MLHVHRNRRYRERERARTHMHKVTERAHTEDRGRERKIEIIFAGFA